MEKKTSLWIILDLIFLVVFNAFFFVLGGVDHSVSVWMSYGFIHFAYLMLVLTPRLTRRSKSAAVFGLSLYSISSVYFFVALVTGVVFILAAPDGYNAVLLVHLLIAGLYGVFLISNLIANENTANAEEKRQNDIAYVKNASVKLKGMLDRVEDKEIRKKVERVFDAVNSSPVKTHSDLARVENDILHSIYELEDEITLGDNEKIVSIASSLLIAVNERNVRLKSIN